MNNHALCHDLLLWAKPLKRRSWEQHAAHDWAIHGHQEYDGHPGMDEHEDEHQPILNLSNKIQSTLNLNNNSQSILNLNNNSQPIFILNNKSQPILNENNKKPCWTILFTDFLASKYCFGDSSILCPEFWDSLFWRAENEGNPHY